MDNQHTFSALHASFSRDSRDIFFGVARLMRSPVLADTSSVHESEHSSHTLPTGARPPLAEGRGEVVWNAS
jgi:hypothetical protein